MSFEDAGNILRTEREKKNYSVEDVAEQLKINPRYIRALENGDFDSLPHLAYVKGFIRSYAKFLEIPQDEIQAELGITENEGYKRPPETISTNSRYGKTTIICLVLVLLIGCGWFLWNAGYFPSFLNNNSEASLTIAEPEAENKDRAEDSAPREEKHEQKTEPAPTENIKETSDNNQPEEKPAAEAITPAPATALNTAETEASNEAPKTEIPVAENNAADPGQSVSASNPPSSGLMPKHQLIITAMEECWVHSNADKTDTRQFSLRKGDTFALTFNVTLELKLGNAGGVKLRYDGRDLPPAGTSGQVKTITFPPAED